MERAPGRPNGEETNVVDQHLPGKRQAILAAAESVFDARGYAAATMDAVAEEAGIAKGSIYNYFRSKQDLFFQVFARVVSGAEAEVDGLLAGAATPSEKLQRLLGFWSQRLGYHTRIGRLVLECWANAAREDQHGRLAASFREMHARWRGILADILAEGASSGEFDPEFDTPVGASLILAVLDGIEIQSILDVGLTVDETFLAALNRAIMLGLKAAPGQTGSDSDPAGPKRS
jgi:AcrR family transcriptional regulator